AQAGVCAGHGALPVVSRGDAADHCRHHAGRGHPEDPPASETVCRPPSHGTGPCPPGSLCLVLCLTAPRVSPPRLRPLPWGGTTPPPSPAPPDVSPHTARGWGGMAVRCPPRTPGRLAAACRQDPLPWQRHARTRVPQSQPPPLRRASSVARALQLSSR